MNSRINYYWRVIATGWCFLLFGLGGLLLTFSVFIWIRLAIRDKYKRKRVAQKTIHNCFRWFIQHMVNLGIMKFKVINEEKLSRRGGQLILASHPTLIDVVLLISLLPETNCIVKKSLFKNPLVRSIISAADYTSNSDDPEELIDSCKKSLDDGQSLIIFPEGTRSVPGEEIKLQRGSARIALSAKKNITPVTITCNPPALMKNVPWYKVPKSPFHITLKVGEDLNVSQFLEKSSMESKQARYLTKYLKDYFTEEANLL
ncbi:lysophospholipid acyltransferase family protein [Pleionea sediminis]|uniref:lysophospholipid acyltransferase family protein n=1 Tax=Pleionea sediminis TaxID=2569479 RepID=UPI0013DE6952|nr:lysophospholipid acyltransferase family protein [Pleionea sediminis]